MSPFQQSLIHHLNDDTNPDKNIVMSFLPYLKKLNDDEKLDFQMHTLQYLKTIIQSKNSPLQYPQNQVNQVPTMYNNIHYPTPTPTLPVNYSPAQISSYSQLSSNSPLPNYTCQSFQPQQLSYTEYSNNTSQKSSPTFPKPSPSN